MTKKKLRIVKLFVVIVVCAVANTQEASAQGRKRPGAEQRADLDRSLEPNANDEISTLFENVVAVQRKAKVKSGKFLFNPYFSFDFSDSPYTMYGLNLNFG